MAGEVYQLNRRSANRKTGPIPVSMTEQRTCPDACALKGAGCYAENPPVVWHWRRMTDGLGVGLKEFCSRIRALPLGQIWRHNSAGDLPGKGDRIDARALRELVRANLGRKGFTYTHKPLRGTQGARNRRLVRYANAAGFAVNVSTETLADADRAKARKVGPVVCVLPKDATENVRTPAGHLVVVCPAMTHENVTCASCKICAWTQREVIVGFPAHGMRARIVDKKARGNNG